LNSTDRLDSSNKRLQESHRIALETEDIGTGILGNLKGQREQLENTKATLDEADGYVDKSTRILKDMGKRFFWF
jgi:vesicle transport through interaction with t-SNAREs protein 1